jgi:hypothetical protein
MNNTSTTSTKMSQSTNQTKTSKPQSKIKGGRGHKGSGRGNGGGGRNTQSSNGRGRGNGNGNGNGNSGRRNQSSSFNQDKSVTSADDHHIPNLKEEEEEELDEGLEHHHCLVCYSPTLHTSRGITPCNHDTICASCHLRLRSLLNDKRCPICKTENNTIIIDTDPDPTVHQHKKFQEYERWGDDLGPNFVYRDDVQMFFPTGYYYKQVLPLFSLKCNVRNCNYGKESATTASSPNNDNHIGNSSGKHVTLKGLNHHLAAAHSMSLCQLCVENKRDFISQLPRFTQHQLNEHNKHGDIKTTTTISNKQNKGHPLCQFCAPKRFYDLTALHEHLNKEHYKCHVCDKLGIFNQFFRDYHKLNMHFDKEHYLCHHPDCLAARFIVFQNDIDLIAHERDVHHIINNNQRSTKINIEFNYRREYDSGGMYNSNNQTVPDMEGDFNYGLNGEVFVPEALDQQQTQQVEQENEPQITHGPHAERTALLREQAKKRREELGLGNGEGNDGQNNGEAFPALSSTAENGAAVGWAVGSTTAAVLRGRDTTALTEENFPSLGGGSRPKSNVASKLRVNKPVTSNSYAISSNSFATSLSTASRNSLPSTYSSSTPYGTQRNTSNRMNSASNLSSENFPSLGGVSAITTRSSNPYAAAQAYAKKSLNNGDNFPSLGSTSTGNHFPALSSSTTTTTTKKKTNNIFTAKKPPALDNILDFPSPPLSNNNNNNNNNSDGKAQVNKMKNSLGQAKYKELKKLTKSFASNELDPESYVTSTISLFDKGMEDPIFWETVPSLISSCPNESSSKRAKRYLESLRYPVLLNQASGNKKSTSTKTSSGGGGWSDHVNTIQSSFQQSSQSKQKSAWGGSSKVKPTSKLGGAVIAAAAAAASEGQQKGTATKFMAKERVEEKKMKQLESEAIQGSSGKKKKSNAKKNELRDLAFGKK